MDVAAGMSTVYGGLHIRTMNKSGYLGLKGSALAIFSGLGILSPLSHG